MKILIVEDSSDKIGSILDVFLLNKILSSKVSLAKNAYDARNLLREHHYDILVLDLALPSFEGNKTIHPTAGLDLLREIHSRDIYKMPHHTIAITGHISLSEEQNSEFEEHFVKVLYYDATIDTWKSQLDEYIKLINRSINSSQKRNYDYDLCVVTALPKEHKAILRLPWNFTDDQPLDDSTYFREGLVELNGREYRIIAAHAPKMGMVATSVLATKMIERFRPKLIAMTGICAGTSSDIKLGDVILANPAWDWQSGKITIENKKVVFQGDPHQLDIDEFIVSRFQHMASNRDTWLKIKNSFAVEHDLNEPRGLVGPAATGAAVIADGLTIDEIKSRQHRKVAAVDMEIYGLYAAALYNSRPKPKVLAIKAVSDLADQKKDDRYHAYACHCSAQALRFLFEDYLASWLDEISI